ncbi:hypothetical protein B7463_g7155, partial [Scytalidium lignicola]
MPPIHREKEPTKQNILQARPRSSSSDSRGSSAWEDKQEEQRDEYRKPNEIKETEFAGPYASRFTELLIGDTTIKYGDSEILDSLRHLNCCYLSTRGHPPTLTQLKQHAQALTILIKHLSASSQLGEINNANSTLENAPKFTEGETFDWLSDLTKPYKNDEPYHNKPLNFLKNEYNSMTKITPDICPLHKRRKSPDNNNVYIYADVQALIRHADDILTRLDHEYSAKGGLLAILPRKDDSKNRAQAEKTILGSLILFTQNLVARMHELEIQYANAIDVLAGEAVVPRQTISQLGIAGRAGRPVCYPQDRFVLANAGNDVWDYLNRELDRQDREARVAEELWESQGVMGEINKVQGDGSSINGGDQSTDPTTEMKGISYIDVVTRFFRLRSRESKTIFVIPAHASHPGVKVTQEMEFKPTVIAVQKPYWPERASVWEERNNKLLENAKEQQINYEYGMNALKVIEQTDKSWNEYMDEKARIVEKAEKEVERLRALLEKPAHKGKKELDERIKAVEDREKAIAKENEEIITRARALGLLELEHEKKFEAEREKIQEQKRRMTAVVRSRARTADMNIRRRIAAIEKRERELRMR